MSPIAYLDFDLLIESTDAGYRARLLSSPAGQATADFTLPFSDLEIENLLLRVGRPRRGVRRLESSEMQAARDFGTRLFEAIFTGDMRANLRSSQDTALHEGGGLRIRLRLDEVPALADLPWEYLYNPSTDGFMVLSAHTPIVRYLDLPQQIRPLTVTPPLRMLVMISSPTDAPGLDVKLEEQKLRDSLADLLADRLLVLETMEDATLPALQKRLRRDQYHIFHFIGHGGFDGSTQDGILLFETESETGRQVTGRYLGTILHDHRPLRLAVLNACEGGRASRSDPFGGVAQSLVRQGIPAVIAMQFEVTDRAAITFAHELYAAVADGYPVDAALAEARKAIFAQENDTEWGTPVLYMRSPDGRIFDVADRGDTPARPRPAPRVESKPDTELLDGLYTEALTYYHTKKWSLAVQVLSRIVAFDRDYEDAAAKLEHARGQDRLATLDIEANEAVEASAWDVAVQRLQSIVELSPTDADARRRLDEARRQKRLADLYREARRLTDASSWQAAVNVITQIRQHAPDYPDADGIFETAIRQFDAQQRQQEVARLYAHAVRLIDAGDWTGARDRLETVASFDPDHRETRALLERARHELAALDAAALRVDVDPPEPQSRTQLDVDAERHVRRQPGVEREPGVETEFRGDPELPVDPGRFMRAPAGGRRVAQPQMTEPDVARSDLAAATRQAIQHYQAGRWAEAADGLAAILERAPDYVDPTWGRIARLMPRARERAWLPAPPPGGRPPAMRESRSGAEGRPSASRFTHASPEPVRRPGTLPEPIGLPRKPEDRPL